MNSRDTSDQQKYREAGEQVARVVGEFMSIANDFSKRFESGYAYRDKDSSTTDQRNTKHADYRDNVRNTAESSNDDVNGDFTGHDTGKCNDDLQKAGEYLRELREAAGYTVDGFAKAMNRHDAVSKIQSVEAGRDAYAKDWLDQISALLKQNDPLELFEKLRGLSGSDYRADEPKDGSDADNKKSITVASRRETLNEIFTDDSLSGLTDSQFEEVSELIKANYKAAVQLARSK